MLAAGTYVLFGKNRDYWAALPLAPWGGGQAEWYIARDIQPGSELRSGRSWRIDVEVTWDGPPRPSGVALDHLTKELSRVSRGVPTIASVTKTTARVVYYAAQPSAVEEMVRTASAKDPTCVIRWAATLDEAWSAVFEVVESLREAWSDEDWITGESTLPASRQTRPRFRLGPRIERYGPGLAFRATDTATGGEVMLWPYPVARGRPRIVERLRRATRAAEKLDSPNLCRVVAFGVLPTGVPFMASELPTGRTLRYAIDTGGLPLETAVALLGRVASALADAHDHDVVHGLLTPERVALEPRPPDTVVPKVVGVGVAQLSWSEVLSPLFDAAHELGDTGYSAPEAGPGQPSARASDIYSLGLIAYELLTGQHAFAHARGPIDLAKRKANGVVEPPSRVVPGLPAQVDQVLDRALRPHPVDRYETMRAFAADLRQLAPQVGGLAQGALPDEKSDTLLGRVPKTLMVRDRARDLQAIDTLVLHEVQRALREAIVAEHEGDTPDGRAAREAAAKLFLDALEIDTKERMAPLVGGFRDEEPWALDLVSELEGDGWPQAHAHAARRMSRYVTGGGDASLWLIGKWLLLPRRLNASLYVGERLRTITGIDEAAADRIVEAGAIRNVLAHLADYKTGRRKKMGRAARWFERDERARTLTLRHEVLDWLEALVTQVAGSRRPR